MIAIFTSETDAVEYSAKVHAHLTESRERYNAEKWSDINKADAKGEWAVKLPPDLEVLEKKMPVKDIEKSTKLIVKYPVDWKELESIEIIDIKL